MVRLRVDSSRWDCTLQVDSVYEMNEIKSTECKESTTRHGACMRSVQRMPGCEVPMGGDLETQDPRAIACE